jgi:hypothetical protein
MRSQRAMPPKDPYFNIFFDFNYNMHKWNKNEEELRQKKKSEHFYTTFVEPVERNLAEIETNIKRIKKLKVGLKEFESNEALSNAEAEEKEIINNTILYRKKKNEKGNRENRESQ